MPIEIGRLRGPLVLCEAVHGDMDGTGRLEIFDTLHEKLLINSMRMIKVIVLFKS